MTTALTDTHIIKGIGAYSVISWGQWGCSNFLISKLASFLHQFVVYLMTTTQKEKV